MLSNKSKLKFKQNLGIIQRDIPLRQRDKIGVIDISDLESLFKSLSLNPNIIKDLDNDKMTVIFETKSHYMEIDVFNDQSIQWFYANQKHNPYEIKKYYMRKSKLDYLDPSNHNHADTADLWKKIKIFSSNTSN